MKDDHAPMPRALVSLPQRPSRRSQGSASHETTDGGRGYATT